MPPVNPHHIIAIGASAGGLDELNTFFDHTPLDGVSYIIVQHLSPDFKSRMVELLGRHSKLVVKEADNEMPVQANEVYLIPNNKFMTIKDGRLYLTDKETGKGPNLTINTFFNSLAENSGKKAIAVVLSGLGSDGTQGIKAIKKAGGMVIARNPETSEFGSMPSNAIATGLVDFVLEPEAMPGTIEDYVKHEGELPVLGGDETNIAIILDLIKAQLPLDFTDYKQPTILRRIKRRAEYNNFIRLGDYIEFLKTKPEEVEALAKDFLISVTSFFRDKEAFDFIRTGILPGLLEKLAPGDELKMWVAGCATGEEAYSLAILLCEQLTGKNKDTVVKIFATDIDKAALLHAGRGIYNDSITKDVSPERLEKYFIQEGNSYKVHPSIRKMVIFAQHDLVKNPPYCNMDFISCRNLLIYMTPALQKKIFLMLLFGLKRDGYLFLGSSENPIPIIQNLETVHKKWKLYRNLETNRVVRFDAFSLPELTGKQSYYRASRQESQNTNNTLAEAVNETLVNEMDCLAVCIDENNHVAKAYGNTSKYLQQKNFNLNLTELLPRPLAVAFNTLSTSALKTNKKVTANGIRIKHGESIITVSLSIIPLVVKKEEQRMLLATFTEEDRAAITGQHTDMAFDENIYLDQYTLNLEEELKEMKNKLFDLNERLNSSNENMQSFNEELLSANEEMQSTNEEMQSVNEELHTINSDYQSKNKELMELNDDLNNYFRSNVNGQLFVNNDLLLMKFSPGTVKQINLMPNDVGRPLSHISTNIKFETIIEDIKEVLAHGTVITKEIETNNGKWYQVMTMPYIKADNRNDGAIISFNDITELKKMQLELDTKNIGLMRINEDLDNFVHTASHDLLAPLGNIQMTIEMVNGLKIEDPQLTNLLHLINSSVKKFSTLINELATIGKIEGDRIAEEMVDLRDILNDVEWSLENKIKITGAVIKRELEVNHILFSKKNLRSIVYNLLSNAIKFKSNLAPIVTISTTQQSEQVILTVQDNGMGMEKGDLFNIFAMYGRLHKKIDGKGIGLYLAKKIINAAGGNIIVESELGTGTRFTIYFKTAVQNNTINTAVNMHIVP